MSNCSVCNTPKTDKYCPHCGQQFTNKKATTLSLILDFFSNFFSVDKSFIGTSRKLITHPKFIVENFLNGNKKYYISPGSFILYAITIIFIHSLIIGTTIWGVEFQLGQLQFQYVLPVLLLPFLFISSYFTFIKQGFHISKHLISIAYLMSLFIIIFIIIDDVFNSIFASFDYNTNILLPVFFIFTFLWNSFVFSKKGKIGYYIFNTIIQLAILIGLIILLYFLIEIENIENK